MDIMENNYKYRIKNLKVGTPILCGNNPIPRIITEIDELGLLVHTEYRKTNDINNGIVKEIYDVNHVLYYCGNCESCGNNKRLRRIKGKDICNKCEEIKYEIS